MSNSLQKEIWKKVTFEKDQNKTNLIEISNLGQIRSTNNLHKQKVLKGSLINGYKIARFKFTSIRDEATQLKFDKKQKAIDSAIKKVAKLSEQKGTKNEVRILLQEINKMKADLSNALKENYKSRLIYHHELIHRLVAKLFLKAKKGQTIVGHLDHIKSNNVITNLQWMTPEENAIHIQKSPFLIKARKELKKNGPTRVTNSKLNEKQIIAIKKMFEKNISAKKIAVQFKVSDMQIFRIKSGENWSHVTI